MEWPARLPPEGGGGVSVVVLRVLGNTSPRIK